jgi:hypothetical protein
VVVLHAQLVAVGWLKDFLLLKELQALLTVIKCKANIV